MEIEKPNINKDNYKNKDRENEQNEIIKDDNNLEQEKTGEIETKLESLHSNEKLERAINNVKEKLDAIEGKILYISGFTDTDEPHPVFDSHNNSIRCDFTFDSYYDDQGEFFTLGDVDIAEESREYNNKNGFYVSTYTIMGNLVDEKTYKKFIDYVNSEIEEKIFKIHRQGISPELKEKFLRAIDLQREYLQQRRDFFREEEVKEFENNVKKLRNFLRIPEEGTEGGIIEEKKKEIENAIKNNSFEYTDWTFETSSWYLSETGKVAICNLSEYKDVSPSERPTCLISLCTKGEAGTAKTGLTYRNGTPQVEHFCLETFLQVRGRLGETASDFGKRIEEALKNII